MRPAFLPAGFVGGCPNPDGLDVLFPKGDEKQDPAAYVAAIDGATSPYERSDRALWPAIAATGQISIPAAQHVDPNNLRVDWIKGSPGMDLPSACGTNLMSFSAAVEIGLNALPEQHGWAYFVSRHGRLLVYGVQNLPVVGPWVPAPPAPGEVIDTSGFTLRPRVVLDSAQLAAVLGGNDAGFSIAATADIAVIARQPSDQRAGQLTAIDSRGGGVVWRAPLTGCGGMVAASANTVWVFAQGCDPKGTLQGDPFVARYDAHTGRRQQHYALDPTWLTADGDTAWVTVRTPDNRHTTVVRLDANGDTTRIATLDGATYDWVAPIVASNGRLHVLTQIEKGESILEEFYELQADTGALVTRQRPPFDGMLTPTSDGVIAAVQLDGQAVYDVARNKLGPRFARNSVCLGGTPGTLWCLHNFQTTGTRPVLLSYDVAAGAITDGAELVGRSVNTFTVSGHTAFVVSGGELLAFGN